jgi:hypothetical protein
MTDTLMKDEILAAAIRELGFEHLSEEGKQAALAGIGENVLGRVVLEVLKILPVTKHEEFRAMIGTASPLKIYTYLSPYIVDMPGLVQRVAAAEIAKPAKLMSGRYRWWAAGGDWWGVNPPEGVVPHELFRWLPKTEPNNAAEYDTAEEAMKHLTDAVETVKVQLGSPG